MTEKDGRVLIDKQILEDCLAFLKLAQEVAKRARQYSGVSKCVEGHETGCKEELDLRLALSKWEEAAYGDREEGYAQGRESKE